MERPLDHALIHHLAPLVREDYEYMRYTNGATLKTAFLSGDVREPSLVYGDIDPVYVEERLSDVDVFMSLVEAQHDRIVRSAYRSKLREVREKYELLKAAAAGDDRAAHDASVRLYGLPRIDMFRYALRGLRMRLERLDEAFGAEPVVREAIEALRPLVVADDTDRVAWEDIRLPEPKRFVDAPALSSQEIRTAFMDAFVRYGIEDWQAVIDAPGERITFNTDHTLRTVLIPSDDDLAVRKYPLTRERVESIIAHEVGTHIVRRERGAASPLALLGLGLAGYLRGEEGIATYREQLNEGTRHFAGGLGYLAVGWAVGLDGTPRTFRGLYDVLYPYLVASTVEHALAYGIEFDAAAVVARARREAWARAVRVFRGTSGSTPGMCFTKDIVYLEGNIAIWSLVSRDASWNDKFSLGKYDPAHETHVALLKDIGLIV